MECKELSIEEMNFITESFQKVFPNRKKLYIIHEKESKIVHSDIGVLFGDTGSIILFTMGMSCTVMGENKRCEVFVELPEEAFVKRPSYSDCNCGKSLADIVDPDYAFIFVDLIEISKMPAQDHEIYKDLDTLSLNTRIYGLRKIFSMHNNSNIDAFYIVQLSMHDLCKLSKIKRSDKEKYLSDRVKPISYNFWED